MWECFDSFECEQDHLIIEQIRSIIMYWVSMINYVVDPLFGKLLLQALGYNLTLSKWCVLWKLEIKIVKRKSGMSIRDILDFYYFDIRLPKVCQV